MSEIVSAETWLYTVLAADSTLAAAVSGIYAHNVPENATYPIAFATMQRQDYDALAFGPFRIWSTVHYAVRGVAEAASYGGVLETIADRIDAVLHAASGSTVQGTVYECVRTMPFAMPELTDGRYFRHLGGIYRVRVI